jgi:hypothetical protein
VSSVFISYSRTTEDFARQLARVVSSAGYDIWLDVEDIPAGMKWSSAIQQGLDTADVMLVVISRGAMASLNVEDEWQYFMDRGKPVIPVLYEPADVHFQLNRLQYIDFHHQSFDIAVPQLLAEIERKITNPEKAFVTPAGRKPYPTAYYEGATYPKWMRYVQYGWYALIVLFIGGAVGYSSLFNSNTGAISNTADNFEANATYETIPRVKAHTSMSLSADSGMIDNPVFNTRTLLNDVIWHAIENPNAGAPLHVHPEDIPAATDPDLLLGQPFLSRLDEPVVTYSQFDPTASGTTHLGSSNIAYLHGYQVDEMGDYWYYVWSLASRNFAWVPASDEMYIPHLPAYVTLSDDVPVYTDTDFTTESGSQSRLRIVGQTDTAYKIVFQRAGTGQIGYVPRDSIDISPMLLDAIPQI